MRPQHRETASRLEGTPLCSEVQAYADLTGACLAVAAPNVPLLTLVVLEPKKDEEMLTLGSPRFVWFRMSVKVASARR